MMFSLLKSWIICQLFAYCVEPADIVVYTKYGPIQGITLKSRNLRNFSAFKGIPYAKPPVGSLRFAAPVPPTSWQNPRSATTDGNMCIQKNDIFYKNAQVEGSEDCLYLNVYTPKLPIREDPKRRLLLPVMVYIHYGGFFSGTGNSDLTGPEFLMDKDIVLVTFNYRLGVFGFLSTNDDAAPGNWGLKDQVAAFSWVRDNIEAFGGHPKKVTIFGQSAGSASVHYHLLSPASANLFQSAISESGSALSLWASPQNTFQAQIAQQQAVYVGCNPKNSTSAMIDCLRKVDAYELAKSVDKFKFFTQEPFVIYTVVSEKRTKANPHPFITQHPIEIIKSGNFHKVPWIIGVVADEGILRTAPLLRQPAVRTEMNEKFPTLMPVVFGITASFSEEDVPQGWQNITNFFLKGDNSVDANDPEKVQGFTDLYSDRVITYGVYQTVLLHAASGHTPIWFYKFDYRGGQSYGDVFALTEENIPYNWGVAHCDDLLYLLSTKKFFPGFPSNANDAKITDIMVDLWTNFATYRNPTTNNGVGKEIRWPPLRNFSKSAQISNSDLEFLHIAGSYQPTNGQAAVTLTIETDFFSERMHFWESLPLRENGN